MLRKRLQLLLGHLIIHLGHVAEEDIRLHDLMRLAIRVLVIMRQTHEASASAIDGGMFHPNGFPVDNPLIEIPVLQDPTILGVGLLLILGQWVYTQVSLGSKRRQLVKILLRPILIRVVVTLSAFNAHAHEGFH